MLNILLWLVVPGASAIAGFIVSTKRTEARVGSSAKPQAEELKDLCQWPSVTPEMSIREAYAAARKDMWRAEEVARNVVRSERRSIAEEVRQDLEKNVQYKFDQLKEELVTARLARDEALYNRAEARDEARCSLDAAREAIHDRDEALRTRDEALHARDEARAVVLKVAQGGTLTMEDFGDLVGLTPKSQLGKDGAQ